MSRILICLIALAAVGCQQAPQPQPQPVIKVDMPQAKAETPAELRARATAMESQQRKSRAMTAAAATPTDENLHAIVNDRKSDFILFQEPAGATDDEGQDIAGQF